MSFLVSINIYKQMGHYLIKKMLNIFFSQPDLFSLIIRQHFYVFSRFNEHISIMINVLIYKDILYRNAAASLF